MFGLLTQPLDLRVLQARVSRIWRNSVVPRLTSLLPLWLTEERAHIVIEVTGKQILAQFIVGDRAPVDVELDVDELQAKWPDQLSKHVPADAGKAVIELRLPERATVTKQIHLPIAARHRLREAAELQIDIETPFNRPDVHFSVAEVEEPRQEQAIVAELVLAPVRVVAPLLEILQNAGIVVDAVVPSGDEGRRGSHNLLPPLHDARIKLPALAISALGAILACQIALAAYLPLYFHQARADAASARAENLIRTASEIDGLFQKLTKRRKREEYAAEARNTQASLLQTLETLTALTPDDAWLDRISFRKDELQISGLAPSTSKYVDTITANHAFLQPVYLSPVMQDPQQQLERFSLSFKLRPNKPTQP